MVNKYPRAEREVTISSVDPSLEDLKLQPWLQYARKYGKHEITPNDDGLPGMKQLSPQQLLTLNVYLKASNGGWSETPETRQAIAKHKQDLAKESSRQHEARLEKIDVWFNEPGMARAVLRYLRDLAKWGIDEAHGKPPQKSRKRLEE